MKSYPSIDGISEINQFLDKECIVFEKCDGSNIRIEWSKKTGWSKFGTRNRLFDLSDKEYGQSINIFQNNFGTKFTDLLKEKFPKLEKTTVFCEFYGDNSFAGHHDFNDQMKLCLFDVDIFKKGFVDPYKFVELFSSFPIPKVYYQGKLTTNLIQDIKNGIFGENEGVVIKGVNGKNSNHNNIWMIKVKTNFWLNKIKNKLGFEQIYLENLEEQLCKD